MDIATYRLRHKSTKQEFSVNKTDYHADLSRYADFERIGDTHGALDAPANINTGGDADDDDGNGLKHLAVLLGSSTLPAIIDLGRNNTIDLGTLVAAAHTNSGLSVEDWNALGEAERDEKLVTELDAQKAAIEAAAGSGERKPEPTAFDAMNKSDLKAFAKENFKVDLDNAMSKGDMLAEVNRLAAAAAQQ